MFLYDDLNSNGFLYDDLSQGQGILYRQTGTAVVDFSSNSPQQHIPIHVQALDVDLQLFAGADQIHILPQPVTLFRQQGTALLRLLPQSPQAHSVSSGNNSVYSHIGEAVIQFTPNSLQTYLSVIAASQGTLTDVGDDFVFFSIPTDSNQVLERFFMSVSSTDPFFTEGEGAP